MKLTHSCIPVAGVDAIPKVRELINKEFDEKLL